MSRTDHSLEVTAVSNKSLDRDRPWWRRLLRKRRSVEVRNFTTRRARVTVCEGPWIYVEETDGSVGIEGIGSLSLRERRGVKGEILSHQIILEGCDSRDVRKQRLLRVLTPDFYVRVELERTCRDAATFMEVIPWMLTSSKYNLNILRRDDPWEYERMRDPALASSILARSTRSASQKSG